MTGAGSFDGEAFDELQSRLAPIWPEITLRRRPGQRTLVVVSSLSLDLPASYQPLIAAYEERYLIYVLALALSLIHISEPTRLLSISYAVFCLKKKK